MEREERRKAVSLGGRIILIFLAAVLLLSVVAYLVVSRNFQQLLTDYSIEISQSMINQGVTTVEHELQACRDEVSVLAQSLSISGGAEQSVRFPAPFSQSTVLRMIYVSEGGAVASDGRQRDIRERQDIAAAFQGEVAVYGPYFNEENEFVICYSAPVVREGRILGVLSLEKDGYHLSELISGIRFINSGESYIINADGTDIAVSDPNHIDWVNDQYNARQLLEEQEDPVTRAVFELEQKGLAGETGVGTYHWTGSLVYVAYAPILSENWVLLAGLREEEIAAMAQSALLQTLVKGPAIGVCIAVFTLLAGLVLFWIITSMKRHTDMNETLRHIANHDSLTGLRNRNSYHVGLDALCGAPHDSLSCVYMDANGLHEINNNFGHEAGDRMLKAVADAMRLEFPEGKLYRIGGDEFVVLCCDQTEQSVARRTEQLRQRLRTQGYEISAGVAQQTRDYHAGRLIGDAEAAMQQDKRRFYQGLGNDRRMRILDAQQAQMMRERQDADTFLSVLAPAFKGVYFVNLGSDAMRHLCIPPYFEEFLQQADNRFSKALLLYAHALVEPAYYPQFEQFCRYDALERQLSDGKLPQFIYRKTNGDWIRLRVLKFKDYTEKNRETLWIFESPES